MSSDDLWQFGLDYTFRKYSSHKELWYQEFNRGVEFVLLIKFLQDSFGEPLEDALNSLERLTIDNPSLIVQFTQGILYIQLFILKLGEEH